ncbi:MAG TPA: SpoIIE family protein phosphatase, partial [Bacteroidia bacterium]|nr:SpoIIE family protein phosphatase [Bacteroidia bacterium]
DVVLSLYMDTASNRLYAGTNHDFGYFQLSAYNDGVYFSLGKKAIGNKEDLKTWHIFKQGSKIVFHTLHALFVYDGNERTDVIKSPGEGIFHNAFAIENGLLVNALENGWYLYDGDLKAVSDPFIPSDKCYGVVPLPEKNNYLLFFRNAGVFKIETTQNTFSKVQKISTSDFDKFLTQNQVYGVGLSVDSKKIILATLINGALLVEYTSMLDVPNILSETQKETNVLSSYGLFTDAQKNTWVLGKSNLSCLPSDLSLQYKDFKGITVTGLCVNHSKLYVASINGLYLLEEQNGLFSQAKKLTDGSFKKVLALDDSVIAYNANEILVIHKEKITRFESPLPVNQVVASNNKAYICCQGAFYTSLNNLLKNKPTIESKNILQGACVNNKIYLLADEYGVLECDESGKIISEYKLNAEFSSTQNTRLYNGMEGLIISNLRNTFMLKDGKITYSDKDPEMRIWLYRSLQNNSVLKFEYGISDNTSIKLSVNKGPFVNANSFMSLNEINDAEFFKDYYYLATKTGLYISRLITNKPAETAHIYKLSADSLTLFEGEKMDVPYANSKLLTFSFSLRSFYNSFNNTEYFYRLSGSEKWTAQFNSQVSFTNLTWGTYTLEVKARYGNDLETPAVSTQFTILKPWWVQWWAIVLWILLFILFVYIIVQISVYRLKESKIRLEHIVQERTQEVVHQKNEIEKQKEEIETKNHEITDSINYAKRIQNSLLKGEAKLMGTLPGSFVVYIPKDIVSGDFYWFTDIKEYHIIAVADCTGHGVPGAFMSMLGVAKLNELAAKNIFMPDELLHELNHLIVETLGQNVADSDSRDGMDIAIICIDQKNKKLFYAGANRPLFIIDKGNKAFKEIKPTKLPVGGGQYGETRHYQLHELELTDNMAVYLSTDGYSDQFGGP